jgi:hypothetical protein
MLEAAVESAFNRKVRAAGGMVVKMAPTVAGVPDRLVLHDGRMFLVELKTETGQLSRIQHVWHAKALAIGVPVAVLHGTKEVDTWVAENL